MKSGNTKLFVLLTMVVAATACHAFAQETSRPPIYGLDFSADGKWLAVASGSSKRGGGPIVVWNTSTWKVHYSRFEDRGCSAVSFSRDGARLAYATGEEAVLLDADTGQQLCRWDTRQTGVNSVAYSRDGSFVATAGADASIKLWDVETASLLRSIEGHYERHGRRHVYSVAFSPDGKRLISSGRDCTVRVWDAATGAQRQLFAPSDLIPRRVQWTRNGYLLCPRWDNYVRIREAETGVLRGCLKGSDHADLAFGKELIVTAFRDEVLVYRVELDQPTPRQEQRIRTLIERFSDDDYQVRQAASEAVAEMGMAAVPILHEYKTHEDAEFRIRTRELRRRTMSPDPIATLKGHSERVEVVRFSPDEKLIASGCRGGRLKIWDADSFGELRTLHPPSAD